MTSWHWLALIAVSISTLYWLVAFVSSILTACGVARISELHAPEPSRWPRISVIIPACNEAHTVEAAVRSKLANRYPELELVLVDDRSSDGTGEIADRISAEDERVRVTHISSLPNGWLGKLNALETGRRAATGEWLLFSDADVHVGPDVLRRVIAWCEATNTDFFSCLPSLWSAGPVVDAVAVALIRMTVVLGRMWKVSDPKSPAAIGVGAFNLVRRSSLDRTGGFEWLKMETADDVALGQMLKRSGARCAAAFGGEDVGLRFLHDLAEAARSSEKAADLFKFQLATVFGFTVMFAVTELAPWCGFFDFAAPVVQLVSALAIVLSVSSGLVLARRAGFPLLGTLLQPIGGALLTALIARGGVKAWSQQGIEWRGTLYPADQLLAGKRFKAG